MFQMKEQDQIFEDQLNKVEISNLPNNEFNVMTTKMLSEQACSDAWMLGSQHPKDAKDNNGSPQ